MSKRKPRRSAAQWRRLVTQYNQGTLSESQYCQAHDLTVVSLRKWCSRFRSAETSIDKAAGQSSSRGFGPIHITPSPLQASMCLELPGGVLLHTNTIPTIDYLAQLTKVFSNEC